MDWIEYGTLFVVAILVTMALIPLTKKLAVKLDAIDYPSARRVNMLPIPRLGGVAMFGGIIAAIIVLVIGINCWGWEPFVAEPGEAPVNYWGLFGAFLAIFITGFIDDLNTLSPKAKLLGQTIAAIIAVASGVLFSSIHNPFGSGYIEFGIWAYPITVFYLVAFANIINLIDGLDGLAAGITVITAATILAFSIITGRPDAAVLSIIIIAVCLGFLRSNFYPASIFMGDSGALMLGFALGVISLFAVARSALFISLLVPILAAGVPIIDTAFAIIRRLLNHRPIDEADKGHIHHQLLRAGFSQRTTVLIMWGWTFALALCAVLITVMEPVYRIPIVIFIVVLSGFLIIKLNLLGLALAHHYTPRHRHRKDRSGEKDSAASGEVGSVSDGAGVTGTAKDANKDAIKATIKDK